MPASTLLPDVAEVDLEVIRSDRSTITLLVRVARAHAACPRCGCPSARIHSRYERKLADLPWNGIPVQVILHTRRFFCATPGCGQRIFTERLPNTVAPYARRTKRLSQTLECFTLALGGEAGARLARQMGILASGDTLLRQLRRRSHVISTPPRMLGIDDWAWRKGRRYGTILCDLERHRVIDLLPDRTVDSVKEWLVEHSGIAIISRDRATAYAEAAREAAPKAVQIADRWHLLRNLGDALQQILESKHTLLSQAAKVVAAQSRTTAEANVRTEVESPAPSPRIEVISEAKRSRRLARYESVMELVRQGVSQCEISRTLGVGRRTVRRWKRAGSFPERAGVIRRSSLDRFADFLKQRYDQGCHNAAQLWCELHQQGFHRSKGIVRRWVHRFRAGPGPPRCSQQLAPAHLKITGSPRQTMWFFLQQPAHANDYLQELSRRCPDLAVCATAAREFARMIRERDAQAWPEWLRSAKTTALARFAASLCNDEAAVLAAMSLPWSNGQVEGQVHRLKLIKRQMYGRAKFDLLRLRVVQTA
jgi:transposase